MHVITQCWASPRLQSDTWMMHVLYSEQLHKKVSFPPEALLGTLKLFIIKKSSLTDLPQLGVGGFPHTAEII